MNACRSSYDVAILGGGLAGLTLAAQLVRSQPPLKIFVMERLAHPAPEAAFKVGESTVEVGAHYFSEVAGMKDHLESQHLRKMGLRYFFSAGRNRDITRRVEVGPSYFPPIPAYQIDRGRFENELTQSVQNLGVEYADNCCVQSVALGRHFHTVRLKRGTTERRIDARWVIDASGRAGLLKKQLGLAKATSHQVNAIWFRLAHPVAVDEWSDDVEWQSRITSGRRFNSTNHLMGNGYWVWIIPLSSGCTSFGIVADPDIHPLDNINTFDKALKWLWVYEPQCAEAVEQHKHRSLDFKVMRHFSHDCTRVFSPDRWCVTGEAGVFLDPFYSPGSDFIAIGNRYIGDLISRDFAGEDVARRLEYYNQQYLSFFRGSLCFYQDQYPAMGNAQVMTAKVVWDTAAYWAILAHLYFHGCLCDLAFMHSVRPELLRFVRLNSLMQSFFIEWNSAGQVECEKIFVNLQTIRFVTHDLYNSLVAPLDLPATLRLLRHNMDLLDALAEQILQAVPGKSERFRRLRTESASAMDRTAIVHDLSGVWFQQEELARVL